MKRFCMIFAIATLIIALKANGTDKTQVILNVEPETIMNPIDIKIYGHFYEHIYRSANGGLWGEMIWDRSFEEVTEKAEIPLHWIKFGSGEVLIEDNNPLNSAYCVKIIPNASATGILQNNINIEKDMLYEGSIWVRGDAPEGLKIIIEDDSEVIAEVTVPAPDIDWKEFPIKFHGTKDSEYASIKISVNNGNGIWVDQVSLMSEASAKNGGFRPDLYQALAGLQPPVIRWPGGCFAELYRWKDAIGPQHERNVYPKVMWDDRDVNSLGTDEFIELCRKLGSEPLIVINTGMHVGKGTRTPEEWAPWIEEAKDWLEYCNGSKDSEWGKIRAKNGHPEPYNVKYWEIDNELWRARGQSPKVIAEATRLFSSALKEVDPSIVVIGHGGAPAFKRFNRVLLEEAAESFDVLSIHHYQLPARYAAGVEAQNRLYNKIRGQIASSANPDIKIYVSEWNAQCIDWRTGLYAGGLLNVFEKNGDVLTISGPALLFRHTSATQWNNAFINFDHTGWFPAPNYVVMKLWREHYAPNRIELTGNTKGLNLVATRSEDGNIIYIKAVNPTRADINVNITIGDGFNAGQSDMKLIAPGSLKAENSMINPDRVSPEPADVDLSGNSLSFFLPRYSVAVVTVEQ